MSHFARHCDKYKQRTGRKADYMRATREDLRKFSTDQLDASRGPGKARSEHDPLDQTQQPIERELQPGDEALAQSRNECNTINPDETWPSLQNKRIKLTREITNGKRPVPFTSLTIANKGLKTRNRLHPKIVVKWRFQ